jgi:hypothetical protein
MGFADILERGELQRYALDFIDASGQKDKFIKYVLLVMEAELRRRLDKSKKGADD